MRHPRPSDAGVTDWLEMDAFAANRPSLPNELAGDGGHKENFCRSRETAGRDGEVSGIYPLFPPLGVSAGR